jgi:hypothetical protein
VTHPATRLTGTRDYQKLPHTCQCGQRWSGEETAHCPTCHHTFGGTTPFDYHRRNGQCSITRTLHMELDTRRAFPCWSMPRLDNH